MMVDVDKMSDAELRTKLLEFGFPVMPITGTTRKVMTKKLKLLLENQNKVGSTDGRRSLGRYSSEEESDTDVKAAKNQKNRRVTMAAPVSSSSSKTTRKIVVEPEVGSTSPKKQVRTTTTTSRTTRVVKSAGDDFDTGSESESDIVASTNKFENSLKYDNSYDDVEFNQRRSPVKSNLSSSFSRYSPPKNDDISYSSARSYGLSSSPSRYTTYGETTGLSGSLASDYAAEKLNQIRSRLSLGGSPSYEKPASYVSPPTISKLDSKETPFLSNFTQRLSTFGSKKSGFDSKNDLVKEHDSNGSSLYGRSYLANFRANKGRDATYDYKRRESEGGKGSFVSYGVLVVAALFFIILAVVYLGMRSDTNLISSGYNSPICNFHDPHNKRGINCILQDQVDNAINLLNSIRPELHKRSVAHHCFDPTIKPQMTEAEIVTFCQANYGIKDPVMIKNDLRNLEVMTFANPEWRLHVAQRDTNNGAVVEENLAKNMEQVIFNIEKKVTSLVILNPELPYSCVLYNYLASALYASALLGIIFAMVFLMRLSLKAYQGYQDKQKDEVNIMVEKIIEILQNAAAEDSDAGYVVINHVRDAILNVKDRKAKKKSWDKAVQYINENESRVRTEVQTVHGESFDVWRWIGSANLSMTSGEQTDFRYRPGRRIVDVNYLITRLLRFPHRPLFFCRADDIQIKNEVREGFFSIYVLRCNRCLKEHSVCSEEPKTELLDVNLAFVAGILSLGLELYQLNELCSAIHIPAILGSDFKRYLKEIKGIYNESKSKGDKDVILATSTPKKVHKHHENDRVLTALEEVNQSLTPINSTTKKQTFLKELEKDIGTIEALTLDQRSADLWFSERKKRLTASNFGRICKLLDKTNRQNVVKDLLYPQFKGNIYTEYGQQNEANALEHFEAITGKRVQKSGLVVHKDYPFLAASPDGVIIEENALVEIKCPYKAKDSTVEQAFDNKEIQFATYTEGKLKLKREDKYYYQVQGQLYVTGRQFCYFVVWTPKGMAYELIEKDNVCWEKMFPKLERFYFDHLLPEILNNT